MIRHRSSQRVKPVPAHDIVRFVAMIPVIQKHLRFFFRHLPMAVRQERIDDALAQAFVLFANLVVRQRVRLAHPTALAHMPRTASGPAAPSDPAAAARTSCLERPSAGLSSA